MSYVKKGGNGGKREGSGRKKLLNRAAVQTMRDMAEKHGLKKVSPKATRVETVLEMLYKEAMKNNTRAAEVYLNRVMGKPIENVSQEIDYTHEQS